MSDQLLHFAGELMSSWWIYLALWGFAALDGFFPAIPSDTLVVTAGVFAAANSEPSLYAVIVVAASGTFAGKGVILGIGQTLTVTVMVELVRHRLRKRKPQVQVEPQLVDAGER